jgi:hypothetical protein
MIVWTQVRWLADSRNLEHRQRLKSQPTLRGLGDVSLRLEPSTRGGTHKTMTKFPIDPEVAEVTPANVALTAYDEQHVITYMRLLAADSEGVDWREIARIVLQIDPSKELDRARCAFDSHLARAKWISEGGRLLGAPSRAT